MVGFILSRRALPFFQSFSVVKAIAEFGPEPENPKPRIIMLLSISGRAAISSSNF
jgi:hypothetical protein